MHRGNFLDPRWAGYTADHVIFEMGRNLTDVSCNNNFFPSEKATKTVLHSPNGMDTSGWAQKQTLKFVEHYKLQFFVETVDFKILNKNLC